jgi:hypothetical protein
MDRLLFAEDGGEAEKAALRRFLAAGEAMEEAFLRLGGSGWGW